MSSTHTRKEALGTQRVEGAPRDDSTPLDVGSGKSGLGPMPGKSKTAPDGEASLDVGEGTSGLGPMPWRKVY